MKRVPTKLKKLAESRARVSGELVKCKRLLAPLADQVSSLKRQLIPAEERLEQLEKQMANAVMKLTSIDEAILKIAPTVNPKNIQPIGAWKNKYGKRGDYTDFLLKTFKNAYPDYYQLSDLAPLVIAEFSLPYSSKEDLKDWIRNSLKNRIKILTIQGILERGEDVRHLNIKHGTWRLKQDVQPTLAALLAQSDAIAAADH